MKVLGILGSPRRNGNAEILLDKALAGASSAGHDTEKIILNELQFVPCQECGGCRRSGECIIKDDMQLVYEKIAQTEALILASPIFFGSLSAQVKAMVDRYQCRWVEKYVLKKTLPAKTKKGYLILVGASDKDSFFQNAESIVKNLFSVLDIEFSGKLYCPNVDDKGTISEHPDCLGKAFELLKNH